MARVKPIKIQDVTGGMNTGEPTGIEDNQFSDLKNMFYDQDRRLQVRRGSIAFSDPIPDTVVLINACDAITDFSVADDGANIATDTARRGSNSLAFDVDVSASASNSASLIWSGSSAVDSSSATDTFAFWFLPPTDYATDLTDIKIHLGSSASDYHEWTLGALTENEWNFVVLSFTDATDTGTPDDSAIDHFQVEINYDAAYTDKLGWAIDSLYTYSSSSSSGQHSLQFHKDSQGTRYLLAGVGENIFEYRIAEDKWEVIKTGLTDGQRFSSGMFKDVISITNGVDNYMTYNGTTVTEHASVAKGKYIVIANDVGYLAGVSTDASTVYYTNANPTDLTTFPNNEPIDEDNGQSITAIGRVGPLLTIGKERSMYIFDSATPSVENIDYEGGVEAHRAQAQVENDRYVLSAEGVVSLAQREATTGALRGTPISRNIQSILDGLENTHLACAAYWPATNNFYLAVDDENTGTNRTIYVLSSLTNAWTYYKGINANEFCVYEDEDGVQHLLVANPYGGQTVEMETGYNDQGSAIAWNITSKTYDFGEAGRLMTYPRADIKGLHSEQSEAEVTATTVLVTQQTKTKHINYSEDLDLKTTGSTSPLGVKEFGSTPFGGAVSSGSSSKLNLYPFQRYMPLYMTGRYITLSMGGDALNSSLALTNINIFPIPHDANVVPTNLYI